VSEYYLKRLKGYYDLSGKKPHLYVVQGQDGGPVKIGKAVDVEKRVAALQTGFPFQLELRMIGWGIGHAEQAVHRDLESVRLRRNGEWFAPSQGMEEKLTSWGLVRHHPDGIIPDEAECRPVNWNSLLYCSGCQHEIREARESAQEEIDLALDKAYELELRLERLQVLLKALQNENARLRSICGNSEAAA
jgi:hypothetical protein